MAQQVVYRTQAMQDIEARLDRPMGEILTDLYVTQGLTLEEVAAALAEPGEQPLSKGAVSRWLERFGIPTRRPGQAA